jgi:hypothetical protein
MNSVFQQNIESVAFTPGDDEAEFIVKNDYYKNDNNPSIDFRIMKRCEVRRLLKAGNRGSLVRLYDVNGYGYEIEIGCLAWFFSIHSSDPSDIKDMKRIFGCSVGRTEIFDVVMEAPFVINLDVANDFLSNPEDVPLQFGCEITEEAAKALSRYQGDLELDGLKELSTESAMGLVKHGDLQDPDDGDEGQPSGFTLSLNGLTELTEDVAEALSDYRSYLGLDGLDEISSVAAKALSKGECMSGISLNGLRQISAEVAESLSKCDWTLQLDGLTEISEEVATALSKHKGPILTLRGLTSFSNTAAESLSKYQGDNLMIENLTEISDVAIGFLKKNPNIYGYWKN